VFPKYRDIQVPLLRELVRRGGSASLRDRDEQGRTLYTALAEEFGLSPKEREKRTEDGQERLHWEKMVRWARQKLLDHGFLTSPRRGVWQVTRDGREFLQAEAEAAAEAALETSALLPEEITEPSRFVEGASRRISVNAYERNAAARARCIAHFGDSCSICGFTFGSVFGPIAEGYIHVHHLRPLAEIGQDYEVDPLTDLRPVCPNCHAVIHLGGRTRTVEEAKELLAVQARR
jgi:5-methylcytosine-specific restriction enzyme A